MTKTLVIPGFPDYGATENGEIWSYRRKKALKPWKCGSGGKYLAVALGAGNKKLVSRLVCEAFHGPPPGPGYDAAHEDGDTLNNCPSNLRWATKVENNRDKYRHGTMPLGADHHNSKLTEEDVKIIKKEYIPWKNSPELAAKFGVTVKHIWQIATGLRRGTVS